MRWHCLRESLIRKRIDPVVIAVIQSCSRAVVQLCSRAGSLRVPHQQDGAIFCPFMLCRHQPVAYCL
jgi:hypothetical protein